MDRGEQNFIKLPVFGAKIYNKMMNITPVQNQISQIAQDLLKVINKGRLLDIGTGHGNLLKEIHKFNPQIELYGLDISKAMIEVAKTNLTQIQVNLMQGNIISPIYEKDFFDLITCTGSFYLWNQPRESLNEIYRILKPNCKAVLFETYKNYDKEQFKRALKQNLKDESFLNKKLLPRFLRKQLRMTYSVEDVEEVIKSTEFANLYEILKVTIASLPIWMRIELRKPDEILK
jgi:ubiquinone/menaquinone biosynthesis C-methylase UbiE